MSGRKDFLNQPAPENYVAGLGRGATGFTTRSDLGPAREGPSEEQIKDALAKRAAQLGTAPPTAYGAEKADDDDEEDRYKDPENEVGLLATGAYDQDDDEADRVYQDVDDRMQKRRKIRRDAIEQREREEYERNNPKIQQQFLDLKRALRGITDDEWANLPEIGDLTGKNRRAKQNLRQRFYAVPDTVISGAKDSAYLEPKVVDVGQSTDAEVAESGMTNFADIGAARDKVLQVRLDQAAENSVSDSIAGTKTSIDPKGYLTSLNSIEPSLDAVQVGDINRARVLLESVIKTNPKHGPGWIAAARLEECAGKVIAARRIIAKGCEICPKNESVWLENIRLNENHDAKVVAANAIKSNDRSIRLWIEAMKLETEMSAKKRVLRRALDAVPQSAALWKEAVNLEDNPADARLLLAKATEIIPLSVDLWLALARLETPENAQVVLNKARKAIPTSHEIWIAAARLQEQMSNKQMSYKVMERAIKALARESAMPKREEWIAEAERCESENAIITCGAIVKETLGWGLNDDGDNDKREIWMDDAKGCISRGSYGTARAIYAYMLRLFPDKKSLWLAAADLERHYGTKALLWAVLEKAVEACPQSQLWMQLAKEKWQAGDINAARMVLGRAFSQNPNNEDIWLAAVKLESDNSQFEKARELLATARREAGTERVWIKSATLEWQLNYHEEALGLVTKGLELYKQSDKLWMMKGQILEYQGRHADARRVYANGIRAAPKSVPLWLLAAMAEEKTGTIIKARSILERGRLTLPKSAALWTESVRLERRANNLSSANTLMAKALQECPTSGMLWAERIWYLEARTQRKARSLEAIKKVDNDSTLFITVARIFWGERRLEKAASWFEKAIMVNSDDGDAWAWYYKFLLQHGTGEKRTEVYEKFKATEPRHGEMWPRIVKDPRNAFQPLAKLFDLIVKQLQ